VWIKERGDTGGHVLYDTVRGATKHLATHSTDAEGTDTDALTSFNNNGFSLGSGYTVKSVNGSTRTYVGWAWKAGGNSNTYNINDVGYATASAAGLTAGTITPTGASVNTKSGFSIITYTGTGSGSATIDHGLGKKPQLIFVKKRNATSPWYTQHGSLGAGQIGYLNATDAFGASSGWNSTEPTNQVFSVASSLNDANTFVAYLWAEIPGFSKFGSYTGNGSADGPFIHTGFRPRWILVRSTSAARDWLLYDTARGVYNQNVEGPLQPNTSGTAYTNSSYVPFDILSNGFKPRASTTNFNASGETHIYAAFAETPTQNLYGAQSNAR
jgi:hypothetical protein